MPTIHRIAFCLLVSCLIPTANAEELPAVPKGFHVSVFASEPMIRNPCAMTFDTQGRLFASQGPQYRSPKPSTQGDRITILLDTNGDGVADTSKTFAKGFNHIQGLAWRGDELWVANAPDLTVVRDLDGDSRADEYRLIYGGLGNLEHALHGLNFAPDGRLYMSKGNSKGYVKKSSPELRVAPKAFAELWGVKLPPGSPDIPQPQLFKPENYKKGYHHPSDDWGTEGGILRCDADGKNLEIISRGMRNPWDITFDEHFNWLGTDQDQDGGDRILAPHYKSHFGWGHAWSPHWTGKNHLPTLPISGPTFHGSGTGITYYASKNFPRKYRGVFFVNDWLKRRIFVFRPRWDGAFMRNMEQPEVFAAAPNGRSLGASSGMLFDPTDIEVGPDGALWVLSWGHNYGATIKNGKQVDAGRVYRISWGRERRVNLDPKYVKAYSKWTVNELIADLRHDRLHARRINAQDELVRRGGKVKNALAITLGARHTAPGAATWIAWTLGRLEILDESIDTLFAARVSNPNLTDRIQALRILAFRAKRSGRRLPTVVANSLSDKEARIRHAAVLAIHEARQKQACDLLWTMAANETGRVTFYAVWRALGNLTDEKSLRRRLNDKHAGVRRAALLALLESNRLTGDEVVKLRLDQDRHVAELASSFVEKVGTSVQPVLKIEPDQVEFGGSIQVRIAMGRVKAAHVRYTLDGTEPTDTTGRRYKGSLRIHKNTIVHAALFRGRVRIGPVISRSYRYVKELTQTVGGTFSQSVVATALKTTSGSANRLTVLRKGSHVYTNRNYEWIGLPDVLRGQTVIQTCNADSDVGSRGERFITFRIYEDVILYVAHDRRIKVKPKWLSDFQETKLKLVSQDAEFSLYRKRFKAGEVVLGGNTSDGSSSGHSQYSVVLLPAPLQQLSEPTTLAKALSRMKSADTRRGERLFFGSAACGKCHRLGGRGNAYAVNLSNLGKRATSKAIAQSILAPSAVITEGFHGLAVVTKRGKNHVGFLRQESGLRLEIVQSDGKLLSILKSNIELRKRINKSMMPAGFELLLSSQQVADLVAYISSQKVVFPRSKKRVPKTLGRFQEKSWGDKSKGFHLTNRDNKLIISLNGQHIASYIYSHKEVKRPFFAHVKTPSGIQVTRNFPPVKGKDRSDHASMHPGLWMAFGKLGGSDFWRNKGRILHAGFVGEPTGGIEATFVTLNRFERTRGDVVCQQRTAFRMMQVPGGWLLTMDARFTSQKGFFFGVQEEMGLGIRVATPLTVQNGGAILSSNGDRNEKGTWGKVAKWWDYFGTIGKRQAGILVMSHPDNGPVWSHSRDYGCLVANPFPVDRAENRGKKTLVRPGKEYRLRFGTLIHEQKPSTMPQRETAYKRFLSLFKK